MINDIYLCVLFVIGVVVVFICGFSIGGSKYRQKYRNDIVLFQAVIDEWKNKYEELKRDKSRAVANAATAEWNNGYDAASAQYEKEMEYISKWLDEHNIPSDELKELIKNL